MRHSIAEYTAAITRLWKRETGARGDARAEFGILSLLFCVHGDDRAEILAIAKLADQLACLCFEHDEPQG